jgi:hypothetical protein
MSQGLKPRISSGLDVRAEARTYLRSKSNGKTNGSDSVLRSSGQEFRAGFLGAGIHKILGCCAKKIVLQVDMRPQSR